MAYHNRYAYFHGFASSPLAVKARYLRAIAPESSFVFIMRHPVVVAMATQRWSTVSLPVMIEHWFRAHRIMFEDLGHLDLCLLDLP